MAWKIAALLSGVALSAGIAGGAMAQTRVVDEVLFGGFQHDTNFLASQREHGADVNLEVRFVSPDFLKFVWSPRLFIGGLVNTEGSTSQGYFGFGWDMTLSRALFRPDDSIFFRLDLGGSVNDEKTINGDRTHKALGSHILFRESVDFGYHWTPTWSTMISFNHISNASLAKHNQGMNDLGLRFGFKL